MKITWQPDELPAEMFRLGRGIGILGLGGPGEEWRVVAFVQGLHWLYPGFDVMVRFDARHFPTGSQATALRAAVETLVSTGRRRLDGVLVPGFRVHVNG